MILSPLKLKDKFKKIVFWTIMNLRDGPLVHNTIQYIYTRTMNLRSFRPFYNRPTHRWPDKMVADKMVRTKWYVQSVWTKYYGQYGTDKKV